MHKFLGGCAALALAMSITAAAGAAPLNYTLSNVKFNDGTSLTGGFSIDDTSGDLLSFDIASENGVLPGVEYVTGDITYRNLFASNEYIFVVDPDFTQYLALTFASPLTAGSNALMHFSSYECDNCNAIRFIVSGDAVSAAVPEAASWAMMLVGFGAVGGAMRARRKVAVSFA